MKIFLILALALISGCEMTPERRQFYQRLHHALAETPAPARPDQTKHEPAHIRRGILKRSTVTGATRQCVYSVTGRTHILTIQSYEICPLNHDF